MNSTAQARDEAPQQPGRRLGQVPRVDVDALTGLSERAEADINALRQDMLKPHPRKNPPVFYGAQVAELGERQLS